MLKSLSIQNIVLIDKADLDLNNKTQNGLYIFTGETGSGKSLLLNAIGLIIGKRSSSRYVSDSSKKATICAQFDIKNNKICQNLLESHDLTNEEDPGTVSIRRVISKASSNKVYINDQPIGATLHSKIGQSLVEIHGQFETSNLLSETNHLNILDQYAKNETLLAKIKEVHTQIKENQQKLQEFEEKKEKYIREKDYIQYVIEELENANIKENEEEELINKKNSAENKDFLISTLTNLKKYLAITNENIYSAQNIIIKNQDLINSSFEKESEDFKELNDDLDNSSIKIDSKISTINILIRELQSDDNNIKEIEERLFEIKNLSRKYNVKSEQLNQVKQESIEKLEALENEDAITEEIKEKITKLTKQYNEICEELNKKRVEFAKKLAQNVENELKFLKMASVKFKIDVIHDKNQISETGKDKIKFLSAINSNKFDSIAKIASGGELSRFMLALKISLMNTKSTPTLIFDEIDTGIGGNTANAVGDHLAKLAKNFQIFVVTHQPQIAAKSDIHFCIKKEKINNKVKTTIEKLEKKCQYEEVARMISGEKITSESLAAAKKLFN